jgi:hypothetical protein
MTVTITHTKVSTIPDGPDTTIVRPSDWNATHTLVGLGTAAELDAGVANGVATLDGSGKIPVSELPAAVLGALSYQGTWNASTNTPTLASGAGTKGYYYVVSVAGSTNLDGITDWVVGDWAVYNGTAWQKVDNTDQVTSVNGQTGAVVLTTTNVAEGTNEYFTTAKARASVSAGTAITYDNGTGVITNSAPDQTVVLTAGTGISTSGTYPNFTIANTSPSLGGDVVGPASATDNAVARFDATTGKLIQNSVVLIDDTGNVTEVNALTAESLTVNNNATLGSSNTDTLEVNSRITTDLEPNANNAKDIGTNGRNWRDGFFGRTLQTVNLDVSGTTSFDGAQGTSGQVLTSAGTGATPTWTTPTTGTVTSVTGTAPVVSSGGATPAISMAAATSAVDGYLTSTDWTTFNSKGSGSVTSVAASVPSFLSITGSPITSSGTLAISYSGTALPIANGGTGLTALGTGVQTAIGVNVGTAGAFVVNGGALGTPSSGTVTNLTGTASININGTVGATTANTGAFTTLSTSGVATFSAGAVGTPAITTTGDTNTGIFFPAADTIAFVEGGAEAMRIDSNGNVGIGTSSPDTLLNIQGVDPTLLIQDSDEAGDGFIKFQTANGTQRGFIQTAMTANVMLFGSGTTEAMRIDTSGNLFIGKTAENSSTIGNAFGLSASGLGYNNSVSTNANGSLALWYMNRQSSTGTTIEFRQAANSVGSITVTASATAYNTSSDYRLKENVAPMQNALATVATLKPVTYTWKADGSDGQGFIAHELQAVVPDCVTGEKDAVDKDGKPQYQGIDTSFLVATLTAAIQEQQALIQGLTERIAALEGK